MCTALSSEYFGSASIVLKVPVAAVLAINIRGTETRRLVCIFRLQPVINVSLLVIAMNTNIRGMNIKQHTSAEQVTTLRSTSLTAVSEFRRNNTQLRFKR